MSTNIDDIIIGDRFRKDLGDIQQLADSIREQGLLQNIGIDGSCNLVFGYRRIHAARLLGWTAIATRVVNVTSIVEGEYAENEIRKDFTPSERVAIKKAIEAEIGNRQGQRQDLDSAQDNKTTELRVHVHEVRPGERTNEIAARKAGFSSEKTARNAETVVNKGVAPLVQAMDDKKVSIRKASEIAKEPLTEQETLLQEHIEKPRKRKTISETPTSESSQESNVVSLHTVTKEDINWPPEGASDQEHIDYIQKNGHTQLYPHIIKDLLERKGSVLVYQHAVRICRKELSSISPETVLSDIDKMLAYKPIKEATNGRQIDFASEAKEFLRCLNVDVDKLAKSLAKLQAALRERKNGKGTAKPKLTTVTQSGDATLSSSVQTQRT